MTAQSKIDKKIGQFFLLLAIVAIATIISGLLFKFPLKFLELVACIQMVGVSCLPFVIKWQSLLLDFLFWLTVIFGSWGVLRQLKTEKIAFKKGKNLKATLAVSGILALGGGLLAAGYWYGKQQAKTPIVFPGSITPMVSLTPSLPTSTVTYPCEPLDISKPCMQVMLKENCWYFDAMSNACILHCSSLCGGDRFSSKEECEQICITHSDNNINEIRNLLDKNRFVPVVVMFKCNESIPSDCQTTEDEILSALTEKDIQQVKKLGGFIPAFGAQISKSGLEKLTGNENVEKIGLDRLVGPAGTD